MKMSEKMSENPCAIYEELLINKDLDVLSKSDLEFLHKHLNECNRCKLYAKTIDKIRLPFLNQTNPNLFPNPETKQQLLRVFKTAQKSKVIEMATIWEYLRKIFSYRIPVYQAAIGAILVIILVFSVRDFSFATKHNQNFSEQSQILLDTLINRQLNILDDFRILDQQKIGRTILEDSVLTSLIFKSL